VVGYTRYRSDARHGRGVLVSFLAAKVVFYGHSVLLSLLTGGSGGVVAQLSTSSPFLLAVFLIGYLNAAVAAFSLWPVLSSKGGARADV
jgi:hypothetical protein